MDTFITLFSRTQKPVPEPVLPAPTIKKRGFRFTETRDYELLSTLHAYDDILSVDQVHRWFFTSLRKAQERIRLLCEYGYIARPNREERYQFPQPVIYTARRAAQLLADRQDIHFKEFHWRQHPHVSKVLHDVHLNEFRHMLETAATQSPTISLEYWYGQDACVSLFPRSTEYVDQHGEHKKKRVEPDGLCSLVFQKERSRRMRFCVEFDNATEPNVRFARDKVLPGIQFVHSKQFQEALNTQVPARYLVVKKDKKDANVRYRNMRSEVTSAGGAQFFLFTRFEQVTSENVLTGKIWQLAHRDECFSLEEYETDAFQTFLQQSISHLKVPTLL